MEMGSTLFDCRGTAYQRKTAHALAGAIALTAVLAIPVKSASADVLTWQKDDALPATWDAAVPDPGNPGSFTTNWGGAVLQDGDSLRFADPFVSIFESTTSFNTTTDRLITHIEQSAGARRVSILGDRFVLQGQGGPDNIGITNSSGVSGNNALIIDASIMLTDTIGIDSDGLTFVFDPIVGTNAADGLIKTGSGELHLLRPNSYSGDTLIKEGLVRVNDDSGLGQVFVAPGQFLRGDIILEGGDLSTSQTFSTSRDVILNGPGGGIATINNGSAVGNLTLDGDVSGSGGLTKSGEGLLTLNGTNTQSGQTTISEGTLRTGGNNRLSDNSDVFVANGATLDVTDRTETIGALRSEPGAGGSVTIGNGSLTVGSSGNDGTFGGVISGTGTVTKTGGGHQTLTGDNTYTGTTDVDGGILEIQGDFASNVTSVDIGAQLTIANGGYTNSATLNNAGTVTNTTTVINTGTLNNNGLIENTGSITSTGALTSTDTIQNDGVIETFGTFTNAGTVDGSGQLTVSGTLNNTGGTIILRNGGVLTLNNDFTFGAPASGEIQALIGSTINANQNLTVAAGHSQGTLGNVNVSGALTVETGAILNPIFTFNTYTVSGPILNNGSLYSGVTFEQLGALTNNGHLQNDHTFTSTGALVNQTGGTILNVADFSATGGLTNQSGATINNMATFASTGTQNSGLFTNTGTVNSASFVQAGTLDNDGTFNADGILFNLGGATVTNRGTLNVNAQGSNGLGNQGTIDNTADGTVNVASGAEFFTAAGSVSNAGTIVNDGLFRRLSGSALTSTGSFFNSGTFRNQSGTASLGGTFVNQGVVEAGSGVTFTGDVTGAGSYEGNVIFDGSFGPGNSPALVTAGTLAFGASNTLFMEIGGYGRGTEYDAIDALSVTLDGLLDVALLDLNNGFVPVLGDTFDLIIADQIIGNFSSFSFAALSNGLGWATNLFTNNIGQMVFQLVVQAQESGVPSPGAILLFAFGLLGLALGRWRQSA